MASVITTDGAHASTSVTHSLREILAFVNDKGGVGKTTTVHNLATALIRQDSNLRVLIIDLDAQAANVSLLCGWRDITERHGTMYEAMVHKTPIPIYPVRNARNDYRGNLFLSPASPDLLGIEPFLTREMTPLRVLCKLFALPVMVDGAEQSIVDAFDYILIDCPPAMNMITKNAMAVATGIVVPMQLEALATFGSSSVIKWAQEIKAELNPGLSLRGILKVMVDKRSNASRSFADHINSEYGDYVFHTEIPRRIKVVEAQAMLQDIFTYKPYDDAGIAYASFAKEILSTTPVND